MDEIAPALTKQFARAQWVSYDCFIKCQLLQATKNSLVIGSNLAKAVLFLSWYRTKVRS